MTFHSKRKNIDFIFFFISSFFYLLKIVLTLFKGEIGEHFDYSLSPTFVVKQNDSSTADIVVFGDCNQAVEEGIKQLENLLDEDFVRKEFREEVIRKLSKSQVCYRTIKSCTFLEHL